MYSDQQIQIAIEIYIHEEVPSEAEDQLWVEFLREPKWFRYFQTLLHVNVLIDLDKPKI
ncbi:MAG: hypothetical protein R6V27_01980 [Balneolaceae bacterium]